MLIIYYSNMMSFFRFVDKRAIYRWYNLIRTCAGECDWLFHWQHKLCATFSANVNINYRLPIKVYYRICTLRHQNRNKSWKPECVLSFNMDWRILVNFITRFWFGIKYYSLMFSWQVEFWLAKKVLLKLQGSRAVTENQ
jgi:hypothetical protein